MRVTASLAAILLLLSLVGCGSFESTEIGRFRDVEEELVLRVATFNIEDLRTSELLDPTRPRPRLAAALLQQIRPDIVLINEIAYDQPGAPGWIEGQEPGQNGQRFADLFLAESQGDGLEPIRYKSFMRPVNTGVASGLDLDNDGRVSLEPPGRNGDDRQDEQTAADRAYGQDAWGFGTFPGQYGMALLVREGLEILEEEVRTFQRLAWSRMPGALQPEDPATGQGWYSPDEWSVVRLSSKSHWDVPVRLPAGVALHVLASHPTPPAFDGPEMRNRKRNHDEIRFWADYLEGADYIQDDAGRIGGLPDDRLFVLLGDLNADPEGGNSLAEAVDRLLELGRVNSAFIPEAGSSTAAELPHLGPEDTAGWGLRVDYVLPSADLEILDGGVWRHHGAEGVEVSDHFPVWLDIAVPIIDEP
ncbi:MAG: endonuclease/exonuclease/phosphatase family protein [Nitrospirae bacterium]|nr:endonuclease/exonuclease/phosphatase family protein [Nitrospirota bacterium]